MVQPGHALFLGFQWAPGRLSLAGETEKGLLRASTPCGAQGALNKVCLQHILLPHVMCQHSPPMGGTIMLRRVHSRRDSCRTKSERRLQRGPRLQSARSILRSAGASLARAACCQICRDCLTASMKQMAGQALRSGRRKRADPAREASTGSVRSGPLCAEVHPDLYLRPEHMGADCQTPVQEFPVM